jgi:hypothetical protein
MEVFLHDCGAGPTRADPATAAEIDEPLTRYLDAIRSRYSIVLAGDKSPAAILHDLVVTSLEVAEAHPHAQRSTRKRASSCRRCPASSRSRPLRRMYSRPGFW